MILPMTTHLPPTTRAVAAAVPDAHDVSPCAPEADATDSIRERLSDAQVRPTENGAVTALPENNDVVGDSPKGTGAAAAVRSPLTNGVGAGADATTHGPDECSGMEPHTHAGMRLAEGKDICWCGRETWAYYSCSGCE